MKKIIINAGLTTVLATALALTGACANIANDRARTQTEGTLGGAGIGAALGATIGAIFGGRDGAATGALIGAGVGGLAGFAYGTSVANKKADYASEEEWLAACLAEVQTANQQAAAFNSRLKTNLASYSSAGGGSAGYSFAAGSAGGTDQKQNQAIQRDLKESEKVLAYLDNTINSHSQVISSTSSSAQIRQLQADVNGLKKTRDEVAKQQQELASISNRMAM